MSRRNTLRGARWRTTLGWGVVALAIGYVGLDVTASDDPATVPAPTSSSSTPTREPEPTPSLLFVTDQKDGDSWVASDAVEYRLGMVNTPELNEPCGSEAAAFTRDFLAGGFTVDAYFSDTYGRTVAEVLDGRGRSLNVALARNGLGNDRYLEQFHHENVDLAGRLDRAFAAADTPDCAATSKPAPLVAPPRATNPPESDCMSGYSPCLPVVADLDCGDVGGPVRVTGADPYRLDRDGDGIGCDA
jgi:endonuclease YncB( thermonuclease family)